MKSGKKIKVPVPLVDARKLRGEVAAFNLLCGDARFFDVKDLEITDDGKGADWFKWFRQFPFVTSQDPEQLPSNDMLYRQIAGVTGVPVKDLISAAAKVCLNIYDTSNKINARVILDNDGVSTELAWYKSGGTEYSIVLRGNGVLYESISAESEDMFFEQMNNIKINNKAIDNAKRTN